MRETGKITKALNCEGQRRRRICVAATVDAVKREQHIPGKSWITKARWADAMGNGKCQTRASVVNRYQMYPNLTQVGQVEYKSREENRVKPWAAGP